jgi:Zn-dependent protease
MECFVIVTVLWIFSVCLHEFGHAWAAFRGGDYTVREKGYLTLNPLKYSHPLYSFVMPLVFLALGGIGLPGGAVYINHQLLRSRAWQTWVALAGPAMTFAVIVVLGLVFRAGLVPPDPRSLATVSLAFLLQLEVCALLLNLLPIPPLDGFQAIAPWLPAKVREQMYSWSNYGLLLLFVALWYVAPLNQAFWGSVYFITDELLGVEQFWGRIGWRTFRFWEQPF